MALSNTGKRDLKIELDKRRYYESVEKERVAIEDRNDSRNHMRLMQIQRKEQEAADQEHNAKEREAYRERALEQEETLAREMDELRRREITDIRERQRLRETSHELKELETKLKGAYAKRELRAQMAENEEKRRQEKLRTMENNKFLEEARINESEYDKHLKQHEINKKHQYRKELQDQMIFKEQISRCKYEEFLKEKKLIDQVVERIHREDERALQEKWRKMKKTKDEMVAFQEAQEIWKKKQRDLIEEENKKIQEYMFSKQSDVQANALEKQKKENAREKMVDSIAKRMYEDRTRQKEREDIQQELLEQELIESDDLREQKEVERRFRQKIDMMTGLNSQVKENEEKKKQLAAEDAHYKEMMRRNADGETKIEFMSHEKGRIRKIQLRKDLEDLISERRRKHAENMELELKLHEQELEELAERNRKIEEERIRMLREHAEHLIGYMPKGILREKDLSLLGGALYEQYKQRTVNYR